MSDAQIGLVLGALATAGAAFVAFLRWCVTQWLTDRKEERADRKAERQEDRQALRENTQAMTTLSVRVEGLDKKMTSIADSFEEISGVHDIPRVPKKPRARTAPQGVGVYHVRQPQDDE